MSTLSNSFYSRLDVWPTPVRHIYITPVKDTMVSQATPFLNYGMFQNISLNNLLSGENAGYFGFEKVDFSKYGITKDLVSTVKLHMSVNTKSSAKATYQAQKITDSTWLEYGVTYSSPPTTSIGIVGYANVAANADVIDVDLTKTFKSDSTYFTNGDFGFKVASSGTIKNELTVFSRESNNDKPYLDITYYDYSASPNYYSINFDIQPVIPALYDVGFSMEIDSYNSSHLIDFDFDVPKFSIDPPVDITYDLRIARILNPKTVDIDFTVPKFAIDPPVDIDFTMDVMNDYVIDIAFDMRVDKLVANPQDITIDFANARPVNTAEIVYDIGVTPDPVNAVDITFDVTPEPTVHAEISYDIGVTPDPVNAVDITFDVTPKLTTHAEILIDITLELEKIVPVDVDFTVDISSGVGTDISFDYTVPKYVISHQGISFDFTVLHTNINDIDFTFDVLVRARDTQIVDFDFDVVALHNTNVDIDVTAVQVVTPATVDFTFDGAQRDTIFVDIDFGVLQHISADVIIDFIPMIPISREVSFTFISYHVSATYGFLM